MTPAIQDPDRRSDAAASPPPPAALFGREWLKVGIALILVAALVAAVHWPVLKAQALSLDDDAFVSYNPLVGHPSWHSVWQFFREVLHPSTVKGYYLPLSMTSLMIDVALGGSSADLTAFHRTGLVLHALNSMLILLILYRLLGSLAPATIVALVFGLHPLTVEPVAWIGERKTLLAAFLAFASILMYLEQQRRTGRGWRYSSFALYALALLSKPTVVMLPLLLLALDAWTMRRLRWAAVLEKWPYFLLSAVSGVITLLSHARTATISSMSGVDYLHWPMHAGYLLTFYLSKILRPTGLTSIYPSPDPFTLANPAVAIGLVVAIVFTVALAVAARRRREPLVGWLWFVAALVPTLGLVQYSWVIASDKYVYFPALGLLMVVGAGLAAIWNGHRLSRRASRIVLVAFATVLLTAEARQSRATLRPWSDSFGLFQHMETLAPDSPPIQNTLGILMMERSAPEEGIRHFRRAVELAPAFHEAHYNLGLALAARGNLDESIEHLRTAATLAPTNANAAYGLGVALRLAGRSDEASREFERALQIEPRAVSAHAQIGAMLMLRGQAEEGCAQFRQATALEPADADLRFKLGSALVLAGHPQDAVRELREALRLRPDWPVCLNALAWLLATTPEPSLRAPVEALPLAMKASRLKGDADPEILDTVAAAQAAAGRFDEAAQTARKAAALATAARANGLARAIEGRARLYDQRSPYLEDGARQAPAPH